MNGKRESSERLEALFEQTAYEADDAQLERLIAYAEKVPGRRREERERWGRGRGWIWGVAAAAAVVVLGAGYGLWPRGPKPTAGNELARETVSQRMAVAFSAPAAADSAQVAWQDGKEEVTEGDEGEEADLAATLDLEWEDEDDVFAALDVLYEAGEEASDDFSLYGG